MRSPSSSSSSTMNTHQPAQWQHQGYPYTQTINYVSRQQPYTQANTPTPPQSNSSSPGMTYSALHHNPSPYPHALPPMSHVPHQSQSLHHPYTHPMPVQSPYPPRRQLPPQTHEQSPHQQTQQLPQQQHVQQQSASGPAPTSSSSIPARGSPLAQSQHVAHNDVYLAPNAAMLYNHANAIAAAQAQGASSSDVSGYASGGSTPPRLPPILQVEKQQVTTSATQAASASRRRNEAHFVCPVPGCGSTFTRRFNLRGHLRSHTEERPYVCEWPGCNKGFARQHDCKRHQALHSSRSTSNVCHGCAKTFSRLDALNRHLRSEGGAECRRTHDQAMVAAKQNAPVKPNPLNAFRANNGQGPSAMGGMQYGNGRHDGSGSSAYDSDGTGSGGVRSAQVTPAPAPAPSLAAA